MDMCVGVVSVALSMAGAARRALTAKLDASRHSEYANKGDEDDDLK